MKVLLLSDEMAERIGEMADSLENDGYRFYPATLRYLMERATDAQMTTAEFDELIRGGTTE